MKNLLCTSDLQSMPLFFKNFLFAGPLYQQIRLNKTALILIKTKNIDRNIVNEKDTFFSFRDLIPSSLLNN